MATKANAAKREAGKSSATKNKVKTPTTIKIDIGTLIVTVDKNGCVAGAKVKIPCRHLNDVCKSINKMFLTNHKPAKILAGVFGWGDKHQVSICTANAQG